MRFPYVFPSRTIEAVVNIFKTIFVAVPAFILVEPEITSGPTIRGIEIFASGEEIGLHEIRIRKEALFLAYDNAPRTNGVVALAAIPITISFSPNRNLLKTFFASFVESSAPSMERHNAFLPPAIIP